MIAQITKIALLMPSQRKGFPYRKAPEQKPIVRYLRLRKVCFARDKSQAEKKSCDLILESLLLEIIRLLIVTSKCLNRAWKPFRLLQYIQKKQEPNLDRKKQQTLGRKVF